MSYLSLTILIIFVTAAALGAEIEIEDLSDAKAVAEINERIGSLPTEERHSLAKAIFDSHRADLFIEAAKIPELPVAKSFMDAPGSDFKYSLTLKILRTDSLWAMPMVSGASGIGSQYQQSLVMCDSVITPMFGEGGIDWSGVLTREKRIEIADQFEDFLERNYQFKPALESTSESRPQIKRGADEDDPRGMNRHEGEQSRAEAESLRNGEPRAKWTVWVAAATLAIAVLIFYVTRKRSSST